MSILNEIYFRLPLWAQNAAISLYGLHYRNERLGGDFDEYAARFRERDRWDQERMRRHVEEELRANLFTALTRTTGYPQKWKACGLRLEDLATFRLSDLPKLPLLTKTELRVDAERFVAHNGGANRRRVRYHSSGSTGTPITVTYSVDAHRRFIAAREVRSFGWAGTSVRAPRSMLGGRMILQRHDSPPPYHRFNFAEHQIYLSAYHISSEHTPLYVDGLNRLRPEVLTGYAYSHYLLARLMLNQGLRLAYTPKALVLSSEKLTAEMKGTIRQAFGARAYEEYGTVENCILATECEHGCLHVSPDFGIVEILDDNGNPVPPGCVGRIVATGLLNDAQPLIRYDVGDLGAWSAEPCPCGRNHLPVIQEIVGRVEELILGVNGHLMLRFHGILINLPHVQEGQLIQETASRIRVKVVTTPGFGEQEMALIRKRLTDERLGDMEVIIEPVQELERTERGKVRAVINRLPKETLLRALGDRTEV